MYEDDIDIPVAIATPEFLTDQQQQQQFSGAAAAVVAPPLPLPPPPRYDMSKGRSSRVLMPDESSSPSTLSPSTIQSLQAQGFTMGLIHAMHRNTQIFPMRIWVVDNSGSMSRGDGHRIAESLSAKKVKLVKCSRWSELQQTVDYHAQIAGLLKAPTVFRLLNDPGRMVGPQQFSIAETSNKGQTSSTIDDDLHIAMQTMTQASPSGCTPLSQHIVEIRDNVLSMLPQLQATGQRVAIILATDGLPTNRYGECSGTTRAEFQEQLRSLAGLPVWLVIRLCTDEDSVVDYYNELDSQLELSLEVLDDWVAEGKEVYAFNPWLNYGLCLHRIREMGFHHRLFDLLDERRFTLDELREFLYLVLGPDALDGAPDPNLDFSAFLAHVDRANQREGKQVWNPVTQRMSTWIDMKKMKSCYRDSCCIM